MVDLAARQLSARNSANRFQQITGTPIKKFFHVITGFDVIAFDEWLKTPDGTSTDEFITQKYGEDEGAELSALIKSLF